MNFTQQVTAEKEEKDFKNQLSTHLRQHLGRSVEGGVESGVQGGVVLVEGPQRRPDPARRRGPHPAVDPERNLITTRNLNQIEPIVHFRTELRPEDKNQQNQLLPTTTNQISYLVYIMTSLVMILATLSDSTEDQSRLDSTCTPPA